MAVREFCGRFVSRTVTVVCKFESVGRTRPIQHSFSDMIFICNFYVVRKRNSFEVDYDCVLLCV